MNGKYEKGVKKCWHFSSVKYYNKNRDNTYKAFGSTDITSDYDITIIGKDAPEIMKNMFTEFLNIYKNTLLHVFDTNIYCDSMYNPKYVNKLNNIQKIEKDISVIFPKSKDMNIILNFSLLKLNDIINIKLNLPILKSYLLSSID